MAHETSGHGPSPAGGIWRGCQQAPRPRWLCRLRLRGTGRSAGDPFAARKRPAQGENPDDCLRSQNADKITQISNVVTPGLVTDGAVTDGAISDGAITDGVVTDGAVTDGPSGLQRPRQLRYPTRQRRSLPMGSGTTGRHSRLSRPRRDLPWYHRRPAVHPGSVLGWHADPCSPV